MRESPNKGCIGCNRGSASAGAGPGHSRYFRQIDIYRLKLNTKCHIGWELHRGALGGLVDGLVDWIGWLSWCGMRCRAPFGATKHNLSMHIAWCYKWDGLYGIRSQVDVSTFGTTLRKSGIELKDYFNFVGKSQNCQSWRYYVPMSMPMSPF